MKTLKIKWIKELKNCVSFNLFVNGKNCGIIKRGEERDIAISSDEVEVYLVPNANRFFGWKAVKINATVQGELPELQLGVIMPGIFCSQLLNAANYKNQLHCVHAVEMTITSEEHIKEYERYSKNNTNQASSGINAANTLTVVEVTEKSDPSKGNDEKATAIKVAGLQWNFRKITQRYILGIIIGVLLFVTTLVLTIVFAFDEDEGLGMILILFSLLPLFFAAGNCTDYVRFIINQKELRASGRGLDYYVLGHESSVFLCGNAMECTKTSIIFHNFMLIIPYESILWGYCRVVNLKTGQKKFVICQKNGMRCVIPQIENVFIKTENGMVDVQTFLCSRIRQYSADLIVGEGEDQKRRYQELRALYKYNHQGYNATQCTPVQPIPNGNEDVAPINTVPQTQVNVKAETVETVKVEEPTVTEPVQAPVKETAEALYRTLKQKHQSDMPNQDAPQDNLEQNEVKETEAEQIMPEPVKSAEKTKREQLLEMKELLEEGLITQEDFDFKKKQILGL